MSLERHASELKQKPLAATQQGAATENVSKTYIYMDPFSAHSYRQILETKLLEMIENK